jgi:hydrogenase maturation protease
VELLRSRFRGDAETRVLDGGTLGLALLPEVEDAGALLVVDAVRAGGGAAGSLVRLQDDEVPQSLDTRLSPHEMGLVDVLAGATLTGRRPRRTVLVGLVPGAIELGVRLSPPVDAALPLLVERVVLEAAALGHPFARVMT